MNGPIELMTREFFSEEEASRVMQEVNRIPELPRVMSLGELRTPDFENNPDELIQRRFLCKGMISLRVGATGVGKSSLINQIMIYFSVGLPIFMLVPGMCYLGKGMRILYIQSENEEGDLAEMRDGIFAGCDELTDEQREQARRNIMICSINDKVSDAFAATVEALLEMHGPFDLLVIDPIFSYLGGEANSQKDVSHFIRGLLTPIITRHHLGLILLHHVSKPLRGKEKEGWRAGDFAYAGTGHSEFANAARAVLMVRSIGSPSIFEFRAAKRGERAQWMDAEGMPCYQQHIAHHKEPGVICWRTPSIAEVNGVQEETRPGPKQKVNPMELLACVQKYPGKNQSWYARHVALRFTCAPTTLQNSLISLKSLSLIDELKVGNSKCYTISSQGTEKLVGFCSKAGWEKIEEEVTHE